MRVSLNQRGPGGIPQRLTNAAANQAEAEAYRSSDPRAMANQFNRAGFSRGGGQFARGAVQGASNYATNMAAAHQIRMGDAFANADQRLQETARNEEFGTALAGLAEDARQGEWRNNMEMFGTGYNLLNGLFGGFGGSR